MLSRLEDTRAAVLQPDLHFAGQDEHPLGLRRAMPLTAEADRTVPQLITGRRKHLGQHRLRRTPCECDRLLAKTGAAVAVGEQGNFYKRHQLARYLLRDGCILTYLSTGAPQMSLLKKSALVLLPIAVAVGGLYGCDRGGSSGGASRGASSSSSSPSSPSGSASSSGSSSSPSSSGSMSGSGSSSTSPSSSSPSSSSPSSSSSSSATPPSSSGSSSSPSSSSSDKSSSGS